MFLFCWLGFIIILANCQLTVRDSSHLLTVIILCSHHNLPHHLTPLGSCEECFTIFDDKSTEYKTECQVFTLTVSYYFNFIFSISLCIVTVLALLVRLVYRVYYYSLQIKMGFKTNKKKIFSIKILMFLSP
jgi:hypothetical protein